MKTSIVLGLGFGDEGKGSVVNSLASQSSNPIVIRFSGGHQVGHTVTLPDGFRHIFSNFGSGTLQRTPTYWSKFCTINPTAIFREHVILEKMGYKPKLLIDRDCPVVIPHDIIANRFDDQYRAHGTVGVGFGKAVERNEKGYPLVASDLRDINIVKMKLESIMQNYYDMDVYSVVEFLDDIERMLALPHVEIVNDAVQALALNNSSHIIFEGSQGILLDKDIGFFPHVTRANTTSRNAEALILQLGLITRHVHKYYVTRCYLTRHGNGPIGDSPGLESQGVNIVDWSNVTNSYQGELRIRTLNGHLTKYALTEDIRRGLSMESSNLVVTCMDQVINPRVYWQGETFPLNVFMDRGLEEFDFNNIFTIDTPQGSKLI